MSVKPIKVLFIAGEGRSGSTLLASILGEIEGFFNAGELMTIWDTGQEWPCSCGAQVENCEIWKPVLSKALTGKHPHLINEIISLRDRYAHTTQVPKALFLPGVESRLTYRLKEYTDALYELYHAVQSVTHTQVIVDSSKNVGYAYILGMVPLVDVYLIHLIRDARATAYSWLQTKGDLWIERPASISLRWVLRNVVTEMLGTRLPGRYVRLNYEDFIEEPKASVWRILSLVGATNKSLPFLDEHRVVINHSHGIWGNPDRFKRGVVELRMDRRWDGMRRRDRLLVNLLTWPLLRRYQYPLFSGSRT